MTYDQGQLFETQPMTASDLAAMWLTSRADRRKSKREFRREQISKITDKITRDPFTFAFNTTLGVVFAGASIKIGAYLLRKMFLPNMPDIPQDVVITVPMPDQLMKQLDEVNHLLKEATINAPHS